MTTHFSSPSRVLRRRKGALKRLPKVAKPDGKRTQEVLDLERARLTELVSGNYQKKSKTKKTFHLDDMK